MRPNGVSEHRKVAVQVLRDEAQALIAVAEKFGDHFDAVVDLLLGHKGKVVLCGMGKSGHIAQKITATFNSTGTPAVFLHPAEGMHGDLGIYTPGDPTIMFSKSGTTIEMVRLIPMLRQFHSPIVAIVGNVRSPIAQQSDYVIDVACEEADPLKMVPTTSALVSLAVGDALASALMIARKFTADDFAKFHPGGQLGRNLLLTVADVMQPADKTAIVAADVSLRQVVIEMTQKPNGAACIVDAAGKLCGIVTDGDVRRALQKYPEISPLKAADVCTQNPVTITPDASLREAEKLMEDRPKFNQLSLLPVVDVAGRYLGLIRLHDVHLS